MKEKSALERKRALCDQIWEIRSVAEFAVLIYIPKTTIYFSILLQKPENQCTGQARIARKLCHMSIWSQRWIREEENQHTFLTYWSIYTICQRSSTRFDLSQVTCSITHAPSALPSLSLFPTPHLPSAPSPPTPSSLHSSFPFHMCHENTKHQVQ